MIFLWGSNARETHPIFFHHVLKAVHDGARLFVVDPRRTGSAQWADAWLGHRRRHRHRPLEHDGARDHPRRPAQHASSSSARRPASRSTPRRSSSGRSSAASARPASRPTSIREVAHAYARADRAIICWTLGHHRAPQRGRQRLRADQPRAAHRPRRPLRLGAEPAPRPEQRAGRRRHGRDPEQAARLPGHRARRRGPRASSSRPGASTIPPRYGWHLTQMFEAMERGELRALYVVGENPAQSEADAKHTQEAARGPRPPGRAGHLPDQDGRAGRRRAAGLGELVRGRGHRHEQRAARPAGAQGARPARPGPRRHRDRLRDRRPHGVRPRPARRRVGLDRAALALADARRHDLSAARGARRHPVAVLRRGAPRRALPPRPAVGEPGLGARRRRSTSSSTCSPSTSSRTSSRSG